MAFSLPFEVKFLKAWIQFNFHGIRFYSNEQNFEKSFGRSEIRTSRQEVSRLTPQEWVINDTESILMEPK